MGLLRILLAISVVLGHSSTILGFSLVGGQIAVQAFYIISGFYMTLILNEKYIGVNNSYKLFISNRLLRLYPIYWVVLILTVLYSVALFIFSSGHNIGTLKIYYDNFDSINWGSLLFLFFTNIFLFLQDVVMFLGLDITTGNLFFTTNFRATSPQLYTFLFIPQAWTIGVEIAFYLIAPFIVRKKLKFIITLIILSLILRLILFFYFHLQNDPWTYRFFATEIVFFLLGAVSYHGYKKLQKIELKRNYFKLVWFIILAFTLLYNFLPIPAKSYLYLTIFFLSLPFIFILSKNKKIDSYIGELSYPIYISHIFVLAIIKALNFPIIGGLGLTLTVLTITFSAVLNQVIAKRIERIRQNRIMPNR